MRSVEISADIKGSKKLALIVTDAGDGFEYDHAAWGSKYTCNINVEMNYWPAEVCGLGDCNQALFNAIGELAESGRRTAKTCYDANGWVVHHNFDGWRGTAPVDMPGAGMWPGGAAWLCSHLWEHWLFTRDKTFLAKWYPTMCEAAGGSTSLGSTARSCPKGSTADVTHSGEGKIDVDLV